MSTVRRPANPQWVCGAPFTIAHRLSTIRNVRHALDYNDGVDNSSIH